MPSDKPFVRFTASDPVAWNTYINYGVFEELTATLEGVVSQLRGKPSNRDKSAKALRLKKSNKQKTSPIGIFASAYLLLKQQEIHEATSRFLKEELVWFEHNLRVPKLSSAHRRAKFWFRPEAEEMIERAWAMMMLLKDHGLPVVNDTTDNPGDIIYEDEHQIAAIPPGAGVKGGTKRT